MQLSNNFLYFPIKIGEEDRVLEIFCGDNKIFEFKIPVGNLNAKDACQFEYDYVARINVSDYVGKEISFKGDFSEGFYQLIRDLSEENQLDEKRPQVHFTAKYGWINDPNGLVYHDGVYHLYFQHNPFNIHWENMSWGHAISKDLIHWHWKDDVIFPDENGTMFSGCGLVRDGEILFPYTVAGDTSVWSKGKPFYQGLAISSDGGNTLQKCEKPFLGVQGKDSRDPKIFWHEESNAFVMVLYIEGNEFAIYRSSDLSEWEKTQSFTIDKAWECPDLLKVPCENGDDKWMFWSADGFYYWGNFDGYRFTSEFKEHHGYFNKALYATQSYWGIADRIVAVPWLRFDKRNGKCYQGAMGIPKEYTCREVDEDIVLLQREVQEFREHLVDTTEVPADGTYVVDFDISANDVVDIIVNGSKATIDKSQLSISVDDECDVIDVDFNHVRLIVDYNILEISLSNVIIGAYKIKGAENSLEISWRGHGDTEGCGSGNRTNCNYCIKSFK